MDFFAARVRVIITIIDLVFIFALPLPASEFCISQLRIALPWLLVVGWCRWLANRPHAFWGCCLLLAIMHLCAVLYKPIWQHATFSA